MADDKQPELKLDPAEIAEQGDPEFADPPKGADASSDVELKGDQHPDHQEEPEAKADEPEAPEVKAEDKKDEPAEDDEKTHLNKTVKALTRRVSALSKEKRELSQKLQQSIREVPAATADEAEGETPVRADFKTQAEFDAAVRAEAARVRAVESFNDKCNAVEDNGSKEYKDKWTAAKANLAILDDQGRIPFDLLTTALETDDPAKVLFVLGNDIDKATELMAMTPTKRAIAMDRIVNAKGEAPPAPRSKTPPPVEPLRGGGGRDNSPSDRDSDEEWARKDALRRQEKMIQRRKAFGL